MDLKPDKTLRHLSSYVLVDSGAGAAVGGEGASVTATEASVGAASVSATEASNRFVRGEEVRNLTSRFGRIG